MRRLPFVPAAIALATAALAACGSAPLDTPSGGAAGAPMVFSSEHTPHAIARCLRSRLAQLNEHTGAGYVELGVGHSSTGYAWLITLTPTAAGSNVRVEQAVDSDSVSEPQLRYAIARCTA